MEQVRNYEFIYLVKVVFFNDVCSIFHIEVLVVSSPSSIVIEVGFFSDPTPTLECSFRRLWRAKRL